MPIDILSPDDLEALMEKCGEKCVSIYIPTERLGRAVEKNPVRLKNELEEAEEQLIAAGVRPPEAREFLEPAYQLLPDSGFWQLQSDGLSLFISSDSFRSLRLPHAFDPVTVLADRFHLKPLLPLLNGGVRFYVLHLSQGELKLLQGTRYGVSEVDLEAAPDSLSQALRFEDPERQLQFHTTTQTPGGPGDRPAMFHGQGMASDDDPKERILRYFHRVDEGVTAFLDSQDAPLVLAGVDYLHPIYHEANSYPNLMDEGIQGNPEQMSATEIHRQAWAIVQPLFLEAQEKAAAQYRQFIGSGNELASDDVEEIVPAAVYGRVHTLFVARDLQRWGVFDSETGEVRVHEEHQPEDVDLLDLAAIHTFLNSGAVYVLDRENVPGDAPIAALLRY
ncbi:MAG: hypothetical protein PVI59_04095 [Anaerolineae bacterium]|jgi:hypothetical protein